MQAFNDNMRVAGPVWTTYHLCNYGYINLIYVVDDQYIWDLVTHHPVEIGLAANDC